MPSAARLREDYSAETLRALARRSKDVNQSRELLSLAAARDDVLDVREFNSLPQRSQRRQIPKELQRVSNLELV